MKLSLLLWLGSVLPQPHADQVCLATTVYLESRDQPLRGQQAVAEVVLRRVERGSWGNDVCAVVTQRKQFAPAYISPNFRVRNQIAWDRAWKVAADTREEWQRPLRERSLVVPGADHFYAFNLVRPSWSDGHEVAKIGGHSFLRLLQKPTSGPSFAFVERCYAPLLLPDATIEQQPDIVRLYKSRLQAHPSLL